MRLIGIGLLVGLAASVSAHPESQRYAPIEEKAQSLRAGQYVWDAGAASAGSLSIVIDLTAQRAVVYRDGVAIAASTVSTGRNGRETPTGEFTVLEKDVVHRSRTYDDAPMPYMQRLTWKGVAMHAGHVPGYPASHGCIRLPAGFAKLLYGVTRLGTPVVIKA